MEKITCNGCRKKFESTGVGRQPSYCSAACRQRAYRKRLEGQPRSAMLRALTNDLNAIRDRVAREKGAIKVLEALGYDVHLTKRTGPVKQGAARKVRLALVDKGTGED